MRSTRGACRRWLAALSMMSIVLGACTRNDNGSWDPRGASTQAAFDNMWALQQTAASRLALRSL